MLHDIIEVKALEDYKLFLRFDDGKSGLVDLTKLVPFKGIFEKLKDKKYFSKVTVNQEIGTICWQNGADLSPELLYDNVIISQ